MVDKLAVEAAIGAVLDPDLHLSLDELGAIRRIEMSGDGVEVEVSLAFEASPLAAHLEAEVAQAVATTPGAPRASVVVVPLSADERAALAAKLKPETVIGSDGGTRVVAVSSGKGGVGKSSVTTNLAVALTEAGHSAVVIDADVWGFSIPKMLGIEAKPRVWGEMLVPPIGHGVRAISMDYFIEADQAVIWRGPMLHKALEQFLTDVLWGSPEFLLIDMPPGTGDVAISISQFVPRALALIVTTPQITAQRVAKRAALMAAKVDQEVIGVVENMSWFTGDDGKRYELFGHGGGAALAKEVGTDLLGQIPLVPAMREGADSGVPIVVSDPNGEAAVAFRSIAGAIVARRPRVRTHPDLKVG